MEATAKGARKANEGPRLALILCLITSCRRERRPTKTPRSANRPDLELCHGTKSSEFKAPNAIPSLANSDPSSRIQKAGHQGERAPVPARGVPRCNHLHPEFSSVPQYYPRTSVPLRPKTRVRGVQRGYNTRLRPTGSDAAAGDRRRLPRTRKARRFKHRG